MNCSVLILVRLTVAGPYLVSSWKSVTEAVTELSKFQKTDSVQSLYLLARVLLFSSFLMLCSCGHQVVPIPTFHFPK